MSSVSPAPRVITRESASGGLEEPYEEVVAEVPSDFVGTVIEKMGHTSG